MKKFTLLSAFLFCTICLSFGQWTYTNLSGPKSFMGSATLGNKAYFAGGFNGTNYLTTVETYNVTTNTCEVIGDLSVAREIIGGGITCGSKVIFPGGFDFTVSYNTVDIFDTLTGQWTVEALSQARFSITSVSYHDTVMIAGGFIYPASTRTSRVDIYNVQTGEWSTAELSMAREGIASAVVGDMAIFAGGLKGVSSSTDRVDIYNFTTKTWSTATLSQARGMANAVTVGKKVIIAGGVTSNNHPTDVVDIYDYETNTWSTATISDPRAAQTNGANISGKAFFAGGGEFTGSGYRLPSDVIDIYDPASNTWSVDYLTQGLINHSVLGIDGYLIVAGGENDDNEYLSQIEIYHDPTFFDVPADYATIQEAINAASNGDTVLVADGLYYENINLFGRKPFMLASNFMMDSDTNHINNTIINGSQPNNPDTCSVVFMSSGEDTTSVLLGFTITGGTGIYLGVFRGGGGVFIQYSGGKLLNNHIEYNEVHNDYWTMGGGVLAGGPIDPIPWVVLRGNRIKQNKAISSLDEGDGGGVDCWYNLIMEDNEVSWNEAEGPYRGDGGGVRCRSDFGHTNVQIRNNDITHNKAKTVSSSTDVALTGGLSIFWDCSAIISGNNISFNEIEVAAGKWGYGTGVLIDNNASSDVLVENNLIEANTFTGGYMNGGGIAIYQSSCVIQNNILKNNTGTDGGGTYVYIPNDTVVLINNTITENGGEHGGGIYAEDAKVFAFNNIIWGNTASAAGPSIFTAGSSVVQCQYSDIEGETVWTGEGNINADPGFIDEALHIDQYSPCTDYGADFVTIGGLMYYAPHYDLEGTPRPWRNLFDMGAYECSIFVEVPEPPEEVGSQQSTVSIYPNPTTGKFHITSSRSQIPNYKIEIVDYLGNVVAKFNQEPGTRNPELDISNLPAGIYLIRINIDNELNTSKIIKL